MSVLFNMFEKIWPADDVIAKKAGENGEEQLARVSARRSVRLNKAIGAGIVATAAIGVPAIDLGGSALEKMSNYMARHAESSFPHSKDERPVPQVYTPTTTSGHSDMTILLEAFSLVVGVGAAGYAARKTYLAHSDKLKLGEIQKGIESFQGTYKAPCHS